MMRALRNCCEILPLAKSWLAFLAAISSAACANPSPNGAVGGLPDGGAGDVGKADLVGSEDVADSGVDAVAEILACNNECCMSENQSGHCTGTADYKCVVGCDDNCATAELVCLSNGACTAQGGKCVVRGDLDCQKSSMCKKHGFCVEGLGSSCDTSADADHICSLQPECKAYGACKGRDGNCVNPKYPTDCANTPACTRTGRCSWDGKRCSALTLADCAGLWCGDFCQIKFGECVLQESDAGCQWHESCKHSGKCHFVDGKCVALSDGDCLQSTQCTDYGACSYQEKKVGKAVWRCCGDADGGNCQ